MIYIYKQCPEESLAGKGQMSQLCCQPCDEGNCCGDSEVRTVFAQLAFWLRDMGQQISGSANYWAYSNTMRGQYYTEINWSGNLQGGEADLCTFAPRTFTGTGAKQKFSFTGCVGCNSTPQEKWCCRGNDMGKFSWQCPCELCDSTPTLPVTFTTGNGWEWDSSGTFGTKGPTYNNQVYWQFPTFQIGPVSTNMCWCTPNYAGWSYFFTRFQTGSAGKCWEEKNVVVILQAQMLLQKKERVITTALNVLRVRTMFGSEGHSLLPSIKEA